MSRKTILRSAESLPSKSDIIKGEVVVNTSKGDESLSFINNEGELVTIGKGGNAPSDAKDITFSGEHKNEALNGKNVEDSILQIEDEILKNENTVAASLNNLSERIDAGSGKIDIIKKADGTALAINPSDKSVSLPDYALKSEIADEQIQSDWMQTDESKKDFIKNRPDWVKAETKPSYSSNEISYDSTHAIPELSGTTVEKAIDGIESAILAKDKAINDKVDALKLGDTNKIEAIKRNGETLPINDSDKSVDIIVPTKASDIQYDGNGKTVANVISEIEQAINDNKAAADVKISELEQSTTANTTKLSGIEDNAQKNVNADWDETDDKLDSYILHKPLLKTAAFQDIASTGNANSSQVVMGSDTRLTDSRKAADVYDWAKAETKPSYTCDEVGALSKDLKGASNGVAELDSNGKVPASQLPSYVDDVIDGYFFEGKFYTDEVHSEEIPSESGKIYIDLTTEKTYRWSGTLFAVISETIALGETETTAFQGNLGKIAYDHSQITSGNPHKVTKAEVGLDKVENKSASDIISEIPLSTIDSNGLMSKEDKAKFNNMVNCLIVTQAEYDALESKESNTVYFIKGA